MSDAFHFLFEGRRIMARTGQSLAAALIAAGERCLRLDEAGTPRGAVCGIGFCWECRCEIDGRSDIRGCMTEAKPGMVVRRQRGSAVCRDR